MKKRKGLIGGTAFILVLLLAVSLAVGFYAIPRAKGFNSDDASSWMKGIELPPQLEEQTYTLVGVNKDAPMPSPTGLAARLDPIVNSPLFHDFTGSVTDALTGQTLWSSRPRNALQSASVMKLLTAQAALLELDPDHRVKTETLLGAQGTLVLRGYGDVTLSTAQPGEPTFYHGAAHLSVLAKRTAKELRKRGVTVRRILVDTSLYQGSIMAPGWNEADISGGFIAPMSPVMVNGARLDPTRDESPRATSPATQVGRALARELGVKEVAVTNRPTSTKTVLATVWSPPLLSRLHDLLVHSDNVLAEAVGREIAISKGRPATFEGATSVIRETLRKHDINTDGLRMMDASGLSLDDRVSSKTLVEVLQLSAREPKNRALLDDLPVSGGSGTLSSRFQATNGDARGWVRAKTGTLSTASSLAGIVVTREGRVLIFAFIMNGEKPNEARPALDTLAATLHDCGCQV